MSDDAVRLTAVRWSLIDVVLRHGINLIVLLILARLVAPADFGEVAILQFFVGLAAVVVDAGFSTALIQRRNIDPRIESSVFWFACAAGALGALGLVLVAPWVAGYFGRPTLVPLMMVLSANLILVALGATQAALLVRRLDFFTLAKAGILSAVVSAAVALGMANAGHGAWSLVAQILTASAVSTASLWGMGRWRPSVSPSFNDLAELFRFGRFMFYSGVLDMVHGRLYGVLVGGRASIADIGSYWRAASTRQMISDSLEAVAGRVSLPMLASNQADVQAMTMTLRRILQTTMFVNVPVMLGLASVTESFVIAAFGDPWKPAAPYLQALLLAGAIWPLHTVNLNALAAMGRSREYLRIEVVKKLLGLGVLLAASFHGLLAIAWSQVLTGVISVFVNTYYSGQLLRYGIARQIEDTMPYFVAGATMAIGVSVGIALMNTNSPWVTLLLLGVPGAGLYLLALRLIAPRLLRQNIGFAASILGANWNRAKPLL